MQEALAKGSGCISFQVVQETLNLLTRKLGAAPADARPMLDDVLLPLWRVYPAPDLYRRALELQALYRYGFYDSLIVAAALEAGCRILYSEDLQSGQRIEQLTIQNPFQAD